MSLLGKYPCDNITAPTYLSFTTAASTALISIVAVVGNFLVILAVILNPNKDLKSPFNYFIANLSCRGLDRFLCVIHDLLPIGLQQISLYLCQHCCSNCSSGADFHQRENVQIFETSSRPVGQYSRQLCREHGEEADYEMGKKDNKDTSDRVIVILSMLSAVMHLYLHH